MSKKDTKIALDQRSVKATEMIVIQVIEGGPLFDVHSPGSGKDYRVFREGEKAPTCTCYDFKHRHLTEPKFRCKHIRAVELWKVKKELGLENIVIVDKKDLE